MQRFCSIGFLFVLLLVVGCASSNQSRLDLETIQQQKVPSPIYDKIARQEALSFADIRILVSRQVPDELIIRAIFNSGAVYHLDSKTISDLKSSHVSDKIIDALLATRDRYYQEQLDQSVWFYPGYPYYPYPYPIYRHHHFYR